MVYVGDMMMGWIVLLAASRGLGGFRGLKVGVSVVLLAALLAARVCLSVPRDAVMR